MNKKSLIGVIILLVVVAAALYFFYGQPKTTETTTRPETLNGLEEKVSLVYAVHWAQGNQMEGIYDENGELKAKGLNQYLDEYSDLHPNIEFSVRLLPYIEYADTLKALNDAGMAPDIYQIYSPWGVSYVREGILAEPPLEIKEDILDNYVSTAGVTIDGEIWGIPTEINDFALLYNKKIFKEAGLVDEEGNVLYPKTWSELVEKAVKLTKKDAQGNIEQYGIAFLGEDWQVVDPFLSLLFSNGGEYLAPDLSRSLFNSPAGVEALEAELELFEKGATDMNGNFFDFKDGKVAMVISPPWTKSTFAESFGDKFETAVGVAPFPPLKNQATLGYSWFMGVMENSANKEEAWKFLQWFATEIQAETGTTRYGDLLANNIGAIPSRRVDFESHQEVLGDFFTGVYAAQMENAVAEPNVAESNNIKAALMAEIQAAWSGQKTAAQALNDAAAKVDRILSSNSR
ncbi:MAG: extracellular solute-binding protein [Patescibacteria group bacterium]